MMIQKSFGLTFTNVSAAPGTLVLYFKWFGGQPAGKEHFCFRFVFVDRLLVGDIKGGFKC